MGQRAGGRNSAEPRRAAARPSPARRAGRLDVLDGPWGVVRVVRHDALVLVAAAVRDASELRHAREAGAGATRSRGAGAAVVNRRRYQRDDLGRDPRDAWADTTPAPLGSRWTCRSC